MLPTLRRCIAFLSLVATSSLLLGASAAFAQGESGSGSGSETAGSGASSGLASTGSDTNVLVIAGIALLVIGAATVLVMRRRAPRPASSL